MRKVLTVKARRPHPCDACRAYLSGGLDLLEWGTPEQVSTVLEAKSKGWQIVPGEKYIAVRTFENGKATELKYGLAMYRLCLDLALLDPLE